MSSCKMTLIGYFNYLRQYDEDLFKNLTLPTGINKEVLTDNILLEGGEFEVIYSDPYFTQGAISIWSRKWYRTIDKWVTALNIEYNPLENYDRMEDWTDTNTGTVSNTGTQTGTVTDSGTQTGTVSNTGTQTGTVTNTGTQTGTVTDSGSANGTDTTSNTGSSTTENTTSAYNSDVYEPDTETNSSTTNTNNSTTTASTSNTRTDDLANSNTRTDNLANSNTRTDNLANSNTRTDDLATSNLRTDNLTATRTGRAHGNIGVTTSQQMLESELDIAKWNLYEHITDLFLKEFVIPLF